jgi:hypothetical protein
MQNVACPQDDDGRPQGPDDGAPKGRPAEVRIEGERGVFEAERCSYNTARVHAIGRRRERTGANYSKLHYGPVQELVLPWARVRSVKFVTGGPLA